MDRREVLKVALAAAVTGCTRRPAQDQPGPDPDPAEDPAVGALERFLKELNERGVSALVPVVSEEDREQVRQLEQMLRKVESKDPRAGTDYRLDPGSVAHRGGAVEAAVRRCCGEGDYTFRIDPKEGRTYYAY